MNTSYPLTIFYDGACGVCSNEMRYYQKIADERIRFVNIASNDFDATRYGLKHDDFDRELHVCDANMNFYTGVDAFQKLWDSLPSPFYPLLSTFVGLPGINCTARIGYSVFARYRKYLNFYQKTRCEIQ